MRSTKWAVAVVAAGSLLLIGLTPASAGDRDEHKPCPTDEPVSAVEDVEVLASSDYDDENYGEQDGEKDGRRDHKKDRKKDECPPEEEPPEEEPEPEPAVAVVVEPVFTG